MRKIVKSEAKVMHPKNMQNFMEDYASLDVKAPLPETVISY